MCVCSCQSFEQIHFRSPHNVKFFIPSSGNLRISFSVKYIIIINRVQLSNKYMIFFVFLLLLFVSSKCIFFIALSENFRRNLYASLFSLQNIIFLIPLKTFEQLHVIFVFPSEYYIYKSIVRKISNYIFSSKYAIHDSVEF